MTCHLRRFRLLLAVSVGALLTACAWPGGSIGPELPKTRIVYRQYHKQSPIFILENLAGRDLVELRSRPIRQGEVPIAFIEDDVMEKVLAEFRRADFDLYAVPRPRNPIALGAKAEVTIIDADRRMRSFLRVKGKSKEEFEAYDHCRRTFLATWEHYPPRMQAAVSGTKFGVKAVERDGDDDSR